MDCNYIVPSHISRQCQSLISSMLCRDPTKRATLDQISNDVWVSSDTYVPMWDMLPLVTREHLSEEDHAHIIQKMVAGSIASRESIIDCLDRNEYNHVTATYFLLAERKLRAQRHDTARRAKLRGGKRGQDRCGQVIRGQGKAPHPAQPLTSSVDSLLSPAEGTANASKGMQSVSGKR